MSVKEMAKQVIDALPDDVTMDDVIHALYIRAKFEHGEEQIRQRRAFRTRRPGSGSRMRDVERD